MDLNQVMNFEFEPRMSDADALLWSIEKDPLLRTTIASVFLLDGPPDRERLLRRLDLASRTIPRLRQRVVGHPFSIAPPVWEIDPNFDLHYHVRFMKPVGTGSTQDLFDFLEPLIMQGFDRARPLWEFTVVEGLADGKAALITKVHHSITDGVGGVKLQMAILDIEREPAHRPEDAELPAPPTPDRPNEARRLFDAVNYEARRQTRSAFGVVGSALARIGRLGADPIGVATDTVKTTASLARFLTPNPSPLSPVLATRSLSVRLGHVNVPLGDLKAAGRLVSGKLNDSFIAGVTGGLRRYHQALDRDDVTEVRLAMPISIRDAGSAQLAGNRSTILRFPIAIDIDDPLERLSATRQVLTTQRDEPVVALSDPLANVMNRLPTTATTALLAMALKGVDVVASNVPGAPMPVYFGGSLIEAQIPFGPLGGAAVNVTLISYNGEINMGVAMDPAAITDTGLFLECLNDSFEEILKLV